MQDYLTIISNFGFPVAVASYLLFRFEKKLEDLERVNGDLVNKVLGLQSLSLDNKKLLKEVDSLKNEVRNLSKIIKDFKRK